MTNPIKTAILISGGGSNMEALIRASQTHDYPAQIDLVICNRPNAGGIARAQSFGVKVCVVDHKGYESRETFEMAMHEILTDHEIELVCNAGFMRILTPWFVSRWDGNLLNIHPSLLPKYKGLHTHKRAIDAGDAKHGCTVHFVNEGVDEGEIIDQADVPIVDGDSIESLAARVLIQEHILYPKALKQVASAKIKP